MLFTFEGSDQAIALHSQIDVVQSVEQTPLGVCVQFKRDEQLSGVTERIVHVRL